MDLNLYDEDDSYIFSSYQPFQNDEKESGSKRKAEKSKSEKQIKKGKDQLSFIEELLDEPKGNNSRNNHDQRLVVIDSDDSDFYIGESRPRHAPYCAEIVEIDKFEQKKNIQTPPNCALLKIVNKCDILIFDFRINDKVFFYSFQGIQGTFSFALCCVTKTCQAKALITPNSSLKSIFTPKSPKKGWKSDSRIFDTWNYDLSTFELFGEHNCASGVYADKYSTDVCHVFTRSLGPTKTNCKIVKIANHRGYPNFHFEINGKIYFYGFRGVKTDYKMVLRCQKSKCNNTSFILPSDFLKQIIQDKPKGHKTHYQKFLDKSDSRVYDMENYDINSFEICGAHKCSGTELNDYFKNTVVSDYKDNFGKIWPKPTQSHSNKPEQTVYPGIVPVPDISNPIAEFEWMRQIYQLNESIKITRLLAITERVRTNFLKERYSNYHIQINNLIYNFTCEGVKSDMNFYLCCRGKLCKGSGILTPKQNVFNDRICRSDPRFRTPLKYRLMDVCSPDILNLNNYFWDSFKLITPHTCKGISLKTFYLEMENLACVTEVLIDSSSEIAECIEKTEPICID